MIVQDIREAIESFEGIPSAHALSKVRTYSGNFIKRRIDENKVLSIAQETVAVKYLEKFFQDRAKFREAVATSGGLSSECTKIKVAQDTLYALVDQDIREAIESFEGIPSAHALSKVCVYGKRFIQIRINENSALFQAYYEKQGLTLDQAIELALQRSIQKEEVQQAVQEILEKRLTSLYAFREMLGVVRVFSELFQAARHILEVSLYPAPVGKALEMDGRPKVTCYEDLRIAKLIKEGAVQEVYNLVVIQGIHRLEQEELNQLLTNIRMALPAGTNVIVTYSTNYAVSEEFEAALVQRGFTFQQDGSGQLIIEPPIGEELLNLGVSPADLSRIRAKLVGSSNVLQFQTSEVADAVAQVPSLVKLSTEGNGKPIITNGTTLDVQDAVTNRITSKLVVSPSSLADFPNQPMMITVMDGDITFAELGFDMHPAQKNSIEVVMYPRRPVEGIDLRKVARDAFGRRAQRDRLGIKPGQINRVSLAQLKG